MHPYDQVVERIISENDVQDARKWLEAAGNDYGVIHEMTHLESSEVIEAAYSRGAARVEVVGKFSEEASEFSVDMLLITLPESPRDREMLFDLEAQIAEGTGFEPSIDEGQKTILLRWT